MRVLFLGDLAGTGFGSVTLDLGRAMIAQGMDLRFISQNEFGSLPEDFRERTFVVNDPSGWIALRRGGMPGLFDGSLWTDAWKPEAAIILGDFYTVQGVVMHNEETRAAFKSVPTLHYIPVEGVDLPPTWKYLWDVIHPVAMSNFGADQIERIMGYRPPMVYHGVNTEDFRPASGDHPLWVNDRPLRTKGDCKKFFGGNPNHKWVFRADRHMPRKRYNSLFRAMAPVLASHPDTFLVTHCKTDDEGGNLNDTIAKYPKALQARMLNTGFHDQTGGASRQVLAALYNAADVYVSVSAEGFGLTVAEAIACGTPAVGIDYSSVPEVIGPAGIVAPIAGLIDNEYDHFWAAADEQKFGPIVSKLLDDDILRKQLGKAGPAHVRSTFSWTQAAMQFGEAIAERVNQGIAA